MGIKDLTKEQKVELIAEVIDNMDIKSKIGLFQVACVQMGKVIAESNGKTLSISTDATYGDKQYTVKMVTTITKTKK